MLARLSFVSWGLLVALACVPACAGGAQAKLEFHNETTGSASSKLVGLVGSVGIRDVMPVTSPSTLRHFAMRLATVSLSQDIDPKTLNNIGTSANVWKSPHCSDPSTCDFFEFARSSDEVNADLNSQSLPIDPGTYRYVRLEFCVGGARGPNIEWQGDGMAAPVAFEMDMCGVTSAEFATPLELKAGDSVTVALGYDLSGASVVGDVSPDSPAQTPALTAPDGHGVGYNDCAAQSDPTKKTCFNVPAFHPTASKL